MATIIMEGWTPWDMCTDRSIVKYMKSHGTYAVWLRGSYEYVRRVVYEDVMGKSWIWFYGKWIEVTGYSEYKTVEQY